MIQGKAYLWFGQILFLALLIQIHAKCVNEIGDTYSVFRFVKCTYKYERYDYKLDCEEPDTQLFCNQTSLEEMHSAVLNQKGKIRLIISDSVLSSDKTEREWTNVTNALMKNVLFSKIDQLMFKGFKNLESLEITQSKISSIDAQAFQTLGSLLKLNISGNTISGMDKSSFVGLESLTYLGLRENNIKTLPDGIFADLEKVKIIDLSHNKLEKVETNFPGQVTEIKLNDNQIKGSFNFSSMPTSGHLLDLTNNKIETLVNLNQSQATEVRLSMNKITVLPSIGSKIFRLDLSLNKLKDIRPITLPNLSFLNASHNKIETIMPNAFQAPCNLKELDLSYNNLSALKHGCFNQLTHLLKLNLSHNQISNFPFGLMDPLQNLLVLDISYNNHTVDLHTLMNLFDLTDLSLNGNNVKKLDPQIIVEHFKGLRSLSIDDTLWNCKELAEAVAVIEKKSGNNIVIQKGATDDFSNVRGIKCTDDPNSKLEYITLDQDQLHPVTMKELASTFLQVEQHNHKKLAEILHEMQRMKMENDMQFLKPIRESMLEIEKYIADVNLGIKEQQSIVKDSTSSSVTTFVVFITVLLVLMFGVMVYNVVYVRARSRSTADQINLM